MQYTKKRILYLYFIMQKDMEKAKQLIKERIVEFKDRYSWRITANEICLFLWFRRQNLEYKPKKQSIEDAYIKKIQNMDLRSLAIWKIEKMCENVYWK